MGGDDIHGLYESDVWRMLADIVPFFVADLETRVIVYTSRWVEQVFGYLRNGLLNKDVNDLVPPEFRAVHERHWEMFRRHPAARVMRPMSLPGLKRDGTTFPVKVLLYPAAMKTSPSTLREMVFAVIVPDSPAPDGGRPAHTSPDPEGGQP